MKQVVEPNLELASKLNKSAWIISGVVFLLVVSMRKIHFDTSIDFSFLPGVYSFINGAVALVLLAALLSIKKGNAQMHRKLMTFALVLSATFLLMYVVYHTTTPETKFCQEGPIRTIYFFLLITHIVLAAVILPFILFTYIRAYTNQFVKHVKMARWVFPLWLYVALTGPILYWLLYPCYQ